MTMRGWIVAAGVIAILPGCGGTGMRTGVDHMGMQGEGKQGKRGEVTPAEAFGGLSAEDLRARMFFSQEITKDPDLPVWHTQREKMALSVGDRVFDKGFDRMFESMITTLATLGCRVNNIERSAGYITASLPQLPPEQQQALRAEARAQYAQIKGYPPSVLQAGGLVGRAMDAQNSNAPVERSSGGLTLSMVKQGARQTKVKLRFDGVHYPGLIEELYKKVWVEVDKQMFLDKELD